MSKKIILGPGRERSLLRHHPWVFAGAVDRYEGHPHAGDTVDVHASDGRWLGRGAWSPQSQIRVRIWTFDPDEVVDNGFFLRRIGKALARREVLPGLLNTDARRITAAESDGLPGITIDRYAGMLVCQLLSAGAERHRDKIIEALATLLPDCAIHERSDVDIRRKEGLEPFTTTHAGEIPELVEVTENGLRFLVDVRRGHKTGFYLDQRDNRQHVARYAAGRKVLNCFSYSSAMGISALAAGAGRVINVDSAGPAHQLGRQQLALNGLDESACEFIEGDVFRLLRQYRAEGEGFDMVILDPPKFVESRAGLNKACRAYKDINMVAMQVLNPGGVLATFSCSGLLSEELFRKVVADAALDAGRQLRYLERLGQAADHCVASGFPEGLYLKGLLCLVD